MLLQVYMEKEDLCLTELNNYTAAIGLPTRSGNFGLKAGYSGFSDYNETQIGLGLCTKAWEVKWISVHNSIIMVSVLPVMEMHLLSVLKLGTIFHITDKLHTGFHINNPVGGKFGKDQQEKLSSVYTVGFGYDASEKFFFSAEIVKEEDQPVNVNAGMQYKFIPQLLARAGMSSATSSAWFGIGLIIKIFPA